MYMVRFYAKRLQTLRGKTIVHVGAHYGQEAALYEKWGAAKVVWVEADPETVVHLRKSLERRTPPKQTLLRRMMGFGQTQHIVIQALVGDTDGKETEFYVFSNGGQSSSIFKKANLSFDRHATVVETGQVHHLTMRCLDSLLPEYGIKPSTVDVLALDVQGAELLCLKGSQKLLENISLLECEVSKIQWYEGGVLLQELDAWLRERGFLRRTWVRRAMMNAVYKRRYRFPSIIQRN